MEFDRSDWLFVRQTERMRRALRECGLPVAGLSAATAPAEAAFGGLEQTGGDVVVTVSIRYGDPSAVFAVVRTSRAAVPLRELIEPYVPGAASSLVWSEGDATVLVHQDPYDATAARRRDLDSLDVEPALRHGWSQEFEDRLGGRGGGHGRLLC